MSEQLREQLAAIAHDQWSGWMRYMFGKCYAIENEGTFPRTCIPAALVERWMRQMQTPYADLPENEKESDRVEADKYLAALEATASAQATRVAALEKALEDLLRCPEEYESSGGFYERTSPDDSDCASCGGTFQEHKPVTQVYVSTLENIVNGNHHD